MLKIIATQENLMTSEGFDLLVRQKSQSKESKDGEKRSENYHKIYRASRLERFLFILKIIIQPTVKTTMTWSLYSNVCHMKSYSHMNHAATFYSVFQQTNLNTILTFKSMEG